MKHKVEKYSEYQVNKRNTELIEVLKEVLLHIDNGLIDISNCGYLKKDIEKVLK